jgi:hypothetical protein
MIVCVFLYLFMYIFIYIFIFIPLYTYTFIYVHICKGGSVVVHAEFQPEKRFNSKKITLTEDYEINITTRMCIWNMFVVLLSKFRNPVVRIIPGQLDLEGNLEEEVSAAPIIRYNP